MIDKPRGENIKKPKGRYLRTTATRNQRDFTVKPKVNQISAENEAPLKRAGNILLKGQKNQYIDEMHCLKNMFYVGGETLQCSREGKHSMEFL